MNNNIRKFMVAGLACVAAFAATFAAPHGGKHGSTPRPATPDRQQTKAPSTARKNHARPALKAHSSAPTHKGHTASAPKAHNPAPKTHRSAPMHHDHARHTPPPQPVNHKPCGFLHPRGHHIGGLHIAIAPPTVLIDNYYWTEEVFINGVYYVLYCYPDGTKRFADGTIYCYT